MDALRAMPWPADRAAPSAEIAASLTIREHQVLELVAQGLTNRQAAEYLGVTALTVKSHLEHIYSKLGVHTRTAAAALLRDGWCLDPARPDGVGR